MDDEEGEVEELAAREKSEVWSSEEGFSEAPLEAEGDAAWVVEGGSSRVSPSTKVWSPLAVDVSALDDEGRLSAEELAEDKSRSYCMFVQRCLGEGVEGGSLLVL